MRGSGLHHRIGSPSENHGKMPLRYPSSSRSADRSPPAATRPFGCRSAERTGGKGVSCSSQGIMLPSALHLLPAVIGQLAHDALAIHGGPGAAVVVERQAKLVLPEKLVEHLPAERAGREQ